MEAVTGNLDLYWQGFGSTLFLTVVAGALALVAGTVVATLRVSPVAGLRALGATYVEVFRNTPLTVVFFFVAFVLPRLGPALPFRAGAILALTLYTSAFVCEAVRSGVNGVPVGQAEAARAIGLTFAQTLRLVVLPQALRAVVPPLISVFIALTKNTSIAGAFFVGELFNVGRRLANANGDAVIAVLLGVAFFYLLITVPAGVLAGRLERRVAVAR